MSDFTSGEWKIFGRKIAVVDDSDTQSYGSTLAVAYVDEYDLPDEWEANARLIAAAPAMYKILKQIQTNGGLGTARHKQIAKILDGVKNES